MISYTICLSLFISLIIMSFKSIHVAINGKILLFHGWGVFHCMYRPHLLYPFICWWTLRELVSLYPPSSLAGAGSESIIWTKVRKVSCLLTQFPPPSPWGQLFPVPGSEKWHQVALGSFGWFLDKRRVGISSLSADQSYWRAGVRNNQAYSTCQGLIAKAIPGISI